MNLHPATVHFPIALLVASFAFDLVGFVAKEESLRKSGLYCLILAVLGAGAGYWTGLEAAEGARNIPMITDSLLTHRNAGVMTLVLAGVLLVMRMALLLRPRARRVGMILYLFVALVAVVSVLTTGYLGAELVQRFGAGVDPVERTIELRESLPKTPATEQPGGSGP